MAPQQIWFRPQIFQPRTQRKQPASTKIDTPMLVLAPCGEERSTQLQQVFFKQINSLICETIKSLILIDQFYSPLYKKFIDKITFFKPRNKQFNLNILFTGGFEAYSVSNTVEYISTCDSDETNRPTWKTLSALHIRR